MSDDRTCKQTPRVMADHLGARPGSSAGREAARHIADCPDCQAELAGLEPVTARLRQWREQPVPAWNRQPRGRAAFWRNLWLRWQWAPLAASMVLVLAVVFNLRVSVNEAGWQVAFGGAASMPSAAALTAMEERWQQTLTRTERELTNETVQHIESVVQWVEERREADLRVLEASFEQMLEREYQTAQSVRQLATYVQYQEQ
ncbi:MAG: hypothetical protein WEB57_06350 [Pseudohongiellaceae bacterium]